MYDNSPEVVKITSVLAGGDPTAGTDWLTDQYRHLAWSQKWDIAPDFAGCHDTGVVMCSRAHRGLWAPPARSYPGYHTGEQNVVNSRLREFPVFPLPRELNYQL